jgi:hypothetical protein
MDHFLSSRNPERFKEFRAILRLIPGPVEGNWITFSDI